jgi:hypothetical protein
MKGIIWFTNHVTELKNIIIIFVIILFITEASAVLVCNLYLVRHFILLCKCKDTANTEPYNIRRRVPYRTYCTVPTVLWSRIFVFCSGHLLGSFIIYLEKITICDLSNRIKIVTIYKNFFSNHDFFL